MAETFLTTYWIARPPGGMYPLGVTAFSWSDALGLLQEAGYDLSGQVDHLDVREGVSIANLDQDHVVPNCGPLSVRGVWFPLQRIG